MADSWRQIGKLLLSLYRRVSNCFPQLTKSLVGSVTRADLLRGSLWSHERGVGFRLGVPAQEKRDDTGLIIEL